MERSAQQLVSRLKADFSGDLIGPSDPQYPRARVLWNAMVDRMPGLIARCANIGDVQSAVRAAVAGDILTAVRCGGHSLAGFSSCEDGLVIDLSLMRDVTVDEETRLAYVGGGCLLSTIDTATQKAGFVYPAGVVSHTGAAGLILGGGTGWLTRMFGMSCDNVQQFTVVTSNGSVEHASARENPDLYWALRGGGGNFGIVTEFVLRLHPLKSVLLGNCRWFGDDILQVLRDWRDFMPDAPDELKWNLSLRILAPDNGDQNAGAVPALSSSAVWLGEKSKGHRHLARIFSIGRSCSIQEEIIPYLRLQTMADAEFPVGRRYYTKSGYFKTLSDDSLCKMIEALPSVPCPNSQIELAYLGGCAARVNPAETAFGSRAAHYIMNILADWDSPGDDAKNISWVRSLFANLRPAMQPGVYVNFMSGDESERIKEAYSERWDRLVAVKTHYDPSNFFRLNQNIPPLQRESLGSRSSIDAGSGA